MAVKKSSDKMPDGTEYLNTEEEGRKGYWMQTFTGRKFWPIDPRVEDINIVDIAHHLSRIDRFNGAGIHFYSVAEHSVRISQQVSRENAMWGLLHDAPEYIFGDLIRPLKKLPDFSAYHVHERNLMNVICDKFGLPYEMPEEVKLADTRIIDDERRDNMANMEIEPGVWGNALPGFGLNLTREIVWQEAKAMFLTRFEELGGRVI